MDAELVGPHVGELPAPGSTHLDPPHRGEHAEHAAGRDHGVELDRSRRLRAEQERHRPGRPGRAGSGNGCGADPARPGSGRVPGRNKLAGVRHVQRLVRPGMVIGVHPGGDRRLRRGQVRELPGRVEQLAAQRPVPTSRLQAPFVRCDASPGTEVSLLGACLVRSELDTVLAPGHRLAASLTATHVLGQLGGRSVLGLANHH